jgi:hypothetical protein
MSTNLAPPSDALVGVPPEYTEFLTRLKDVPDSEVVDIPVQHDLHGGLLARTIFVSAGTAAMGCVHAVDSLTIIQGHLYLRSATGIEEVRGFGVFPCAANQWRAIYAVEDSIITTVLKTDYKSLVDLDKIQKDSVMNYQDIASNNLPMELT